MKVLTNASTPGLWKIGNKSFPKKNLAKKAPLSGTVILGNFIEIVSDIILQRHFIE